MIPIAYIRYKVGDDLHKIVRDVCKKLGIKESELSRTALMDYLKSIGVLSDRIRRK